MALFSKFGSKSPREGSTVLPETSVEMSSMMQITHETAGTHEPRAAGALPLIGGMPLVRQQRILLIVLIVALALLGTGIALTLRAATGSASLLDSSGDALMQSQRVAKSISAALLGSDAAFGELRDSAATLDADFNDMQRSAALGSAAGALAQLRPAVTDMVKNARAVVTLAPLLSATNKSLLAVASQSNALLDTTTALTDALVQQNAPAAQVSAAAELGMLTQRIGKSANAFMSLDGVSAAAVFSLGKDLDTFDQVCQGLVQGDPARAIEPLHDAQTRAQGQALCAAFGTTRAMTGGVLSNLQSITGARAAQAAVLKDAATVLSGLEAMRHRDAARASVGLPVLAFIGATGFLVLLALAGLARLYVHETRQRAKQSERQRHQAERLELEARRSNEANQAAILRLMNELQSVAEGDLTQRATVTEDITGAIADSVNFTVEELSSLVSQVQATADQVGRATAQARTTSAELLQSSEQQLSEIRQTGQSVLDMAGRINTVSSQAQQSADVARQSLTAAEQGLLAVRNSIEGMNAIRSQIQDTSKRIKRLGESSQEIGEITELISDLTEQTNVLALNAAIQAASAGDAGRGFSVVAEEVQRLAERSAEAAKQIAALVRTIQTDTQDAVAAMEKSTQGVVEGARLSDSAGTALSEIDRVSRQLAELIQRISEQAQTEARSANEVADNIQHIFVVTEQTSAGTRSTAELVSELARVAEALRESIARFKID